MSSPASKTRKLIILWTYTNWGGAQVYFMAIIKAALRDWDVIVCLPNGSKQELVAHLNQLGVRIEFVNNRFDPKVETSISGKLKRQYERLRSEINTFRYLLRFDLSQSILHIETGPWQSWQLLVSLALRRANVFATLHNFRPEGPVWRRLVWKIRLQVVSRLPGFHICASNVDTKTNLKGWVSDSFWEQIPVTYTSVDPCQIEEALQEEFHQPTERSRHGIPKESFVVLTVGQFIDRKGRWILLDVAATLKDQYPDIVFVWVMPDGISKVDIERIELSGVEKSFIPLRSGDIGKDRVSILRFFRIANVFALPSLVEGLPIALLEAMALGVPSISTNVYAIPEAVIPNITGLLIEPGDPKQLAASILRLKKDPRLCSRLADSGRKYVMDRFDERVASSICLEAYERCFS